MEARYLRAATVLALAFFGLGASYRTTNFIVSAESPDFARQVGEAAEAYRRNLALEWTGRELPRWPQPCPIRVQDGPNLGAGGMTSFFFAHGQPNDFQMSVQGSRERILDSVLPHEVTHTIFATHFGRPLPRWADEGACTTVEHDSEKEKQHRLLYEFLTTNRGIAFNQMFAMKEYPRDILPLYAQGFSLAKFLIAQGGKRKFMDYLGEGMQSNNWTAATRKHYGFQDLSELQTTWTAWVGQGCPALEPRGNAPSAAMPTESLAGAIPRNVEPTSAPAPLFAASEPRMAALPLAAGPAGSLLAQSPLHGRTTTAAAPIAPLLTPLDPPPAPSAIPFPAQVASDSPSPTNANAWNARGPEGRSHAPPDGGNPLRVAGEVAPPLPPVTPAADLQWTQPQIPGGSMAAAQPAGYGQPIGALPPAHGQLAPAGQAGPVPQAVTRPQSTERPREIILEWSRGGAGQYR